MLPLPEESEIEQVPAAGLLETFVATRAELVRFLAKRVRCLFTARDLAQEVYLRTLRVESGTVGKPRALLFEIAANLATDHGRWEARRAELLKEAYELLGSEADARSPEREALGKDELSQICEALERLPERSRLVFYLNRFEGLTQKEIADRLGISRTSTERHMRRALRCVSETRARLEGALC